MLYIKYLFESAPLQTFKEFRYDLQSGCNNVLTSAKNQCETCHSTCLWTAVQHPMYNLMKNPQ